MYLVGQLVNYEQLGHLNPFRISTLKEGATLREAL